MILRSHAWIDGARVLYQEGTLDAMLPVKDLIARGFGDRGLPDGCAMFGGTFAAKGGIRPASRFEFELEDPVLKRTIRHGYDVITLPERGCRRPALSGTTRGIWSEIGWHQRGLICEVRAMKATAKDIRSVSTGDLASRVDAIDWTQATADLDAQGCAVLKGLLAPDECRAIAALYPDDAHFRSRIVMGRHGFGRGEYKYFSLSAARSDRGTAPGALCAGSRRSPIAGTRRWASISAIPRRIEAFLKRCHAAGQTRPTPLLLQYGAGDYNCLHQDLYGEHVFPLQVAILLSEPGRDFEGGEFVLTEQRPRMQSRPEVVPLRQGDAVAFAVHHRPVQGTRGFYRVNLRHGVSRIRSGHRHTVGMIFHDAK